MYACITIFRTFLTNKTKKTNGNKIKCKNKNDCWKQYLQAWLNIKWFLNFLNSEVWDLQILNNFSHTVPVGLSKMPILLLSKASYSDAIKSVWIEYGSNGKPKFLPSCFASPVLTILNFYFYIIIMFLVWNIKIIFLLYLTKPHKTFTILKKIDNHFPNFSLAGPEVVPELMSINVHLCF